MYMCVCVCGGGGGGIYAFAFAFAYAYVYAYAYAYAENLEVSNLTSEYGLGVYIFKYSTFGIALGVYKFYLGVA